LTDIAGKSEAEAVPVGGVITVATFEIFLTSVLRLSGVWSAELRVIVSLTLGVARPPPEKWSGRGMPAIYCPNWETSVSTSPEAAETAFTTIVAGSTGPSQR